MDYRRRGSAWRGALLKAVAPRLVTVLLRGGASAQGWLTTLLARLPRAEQGAFRRLWSKLDVQGRRSLDAVERGELRALASRLEALIGAPLTQQEKDALRSMAREDFFTRFHPELASRLLTARGSRYPVHHRRPLEFAHLFPEDDINARLNLTALGEPVHESINAVWTAFRPMGKTARAEDVDAVVVLIDKHFGHWYNVPYEKRTAAALAEAEAAAMEEFGRFVSRMSQRK